MLDGQRVAHTAGGSYYLSDKIRLREHNVHAANRNKERQFQGPELEMSSEMPSMRCPKS